jgi:hypothetical protein
MFWNYHARQKRIKMMQNIQVTSKSSLKLQCLMITKGNVKEAKELYEFLADDMPSLPDYDPLPTSWVDDTKDTVTGLMGWIKENQDTIANIIQLGRNIVGGKSASSNVTPTTPLPPIN